MAEHVKATITLVTKQNIMRETIDQLFESGEFLPLMGFATVGEGGVGL